MAVSQISVDHAGEFVASCSTDGRVILTGLYSSEYNYSMNTGKPIYSVGLDPIFARADSGKRFMTGDDDKVVLYERRGLLNRYFFSFVLKSGERRKMVDWILNFESSLEAANQIFLPN